MKTILVPTDFSETANNALQVAAQLSKKFGAKLIVLHMLEIAEHIIPDSLIANDLVNSRANSASDVPAALYYMKLAQKRFAELRELSFLKDVDFEEAIQNHLSFKGIVDSAHKYDADFIVMGSHGTSGFKENFVGSNTEKVVRTSDVPVLVIKEENQNFAVDNFVFASNMESENVEALVDAYNLASDLNATLHVVYINTPGRDFLTNKQFDEKMHQFISAASMEFNNLTTNIYNDVSKEEGVLNFSKKINADLIGIPTHGRKGLAHFMTQSLSEDLVNHAKTPVVTFKIR